MRLSRQRRDHLIAVLGKAEVAAGSVQVTDIAAGFKGELNTRDFVRLVRDAYKGRQSHVDWPNAGYLGGAGSAVSDPP